MTYHSQRPQCLSLSPHVLVEELTFAVKKLHFAVEKLTFAVEKLHFAVEKLTFAVEKLTFAVEKLTFAVPLWGHRIRMISRHLFLYGELSTKNKNLRFLACTHASIFKNFGSNSSSSQILRTHADVCRSIQTYKSTKITI